MNNKVRCRSTMLNSCLKTESKLEISVFYVVPKYFRCPNWVKLIADDPSLYLVFSYIFLLKKHFTQKFWREKLIYLVSKYRYVIIRHFEFFTYLNKYLFKDFAKKTLWILHIIENQILYQVTIMLSK